MLRASTPWAACMTLLPSEMKIFEMNAIGYEERKATYEGGDPLENQISLLEEKGGDAE